MSNMTIPQYTAAGSIDPVQDKFLMWQNSTNSYVSISRNTIMGTTGTPVDTSSSQTLTNKTLTGPSISSPVLSGTITGTYTLGGTPTFPSTVVTTTGTQTLTNKTLTSPSISGGTIDNSTITVDTISGHSTPNSGTIYGVPITSGTLGTNTVVTSSITDGAVTPAKLLAGTGSSWAWQSWTPTWTGASGNPAIGNGTIIGRYLQTGKTVQFRLDILAGSTTTFGTGAWTFTLPVTAAANYTATYAMGIGSYEKPGTGDYFGPINLMSTTTFQMWYSTGTNSNVLGSAAPEAWNSTSFFRMTATYEAA